MVTQGSSIGTGRRLWGWRWAVLALLIVAGLTALAAYLTFGRGQQTVTTLARPIARTITAQAGVVPAVQQKLGFATAGKIDRVGVSAGDQVKSGDVLATLDTTDLDLKVQDAAANLALQTALIAQSADPPASADLAADQAAVTSALARQQQVGAGSLPGDVKVDQENVAAAQAALASAQAQQSKVGAPPTASDLAAAEASIQSAQAQLANAQQKLSDLRAQPLAQDISTARLSVDQAKNTLWAQQLSRDATCGAFGANSGQCSSASASVAAADTAVQSAQSALSKASLAATPDQLSAANSSVRSANAAVTSAEQSLEQLKSGSSSAERDAARAGVEQAAANLRSAQDKLDQLTSGVSDADRAAAESAVEQAQASLAKLVATPSAATVDVSKAKLRQAQVTLEESQAALKSAVMVAPFDGQITSVALKSGDSAGPGVTVMTIADLTALRFETNDLDEVSAAQVHAGQIARVTVAALDKRVFVGKVVELSIEPAITPSGDVNYVAKIALDSIPAGLRWGQTARIEFQP